MRVGNKFFFFCLVGATGAVIEIILFNLFFLFLIFEYAKALALFLALLVNFSMNRNITFLAKSGRIHRQATKYIVVYSIAVCFNFFISLSVSSVLGDGVIRANIAAVSGIVAAIPISFFGSLYWVFGKTNLQLS